MQKWMKGVPKYSQFYNAGILDFPQRRETWDSHDPTGKSVYHKLLTI